MWSCRRMRRGQNFVAGKHIVTYDGGGTPYSTYTLSRPTSRNGANQATILDRRTTAFPGRISRQLSASGNDGTHMTPINTGGTVCYTDSTTAVGLDCVAYTSGPTMFPSPPPSPFGTPFTLPGGHLGPNQSLIRSISRGCATALDAADDTNNSAADFTIGAGSPRSNTATPTETPVRCSADDEEEVQEAQEEAPQRVSRPRRRSARRRSTTDLLNPFSLLTRSSQW